MRHEGAYKRGPINPGNEFLMTRTYKTQTTYIQQNKAQGCAHFPPDLIVLVAKNQFLDESSTNRKNAQNQNKN